MRLQILAAWILLATVPVYAQTRSGTPAAPATAPQPDLNAIPAELLQSQLGQQLPGLWRIAEFGIDAQTNLGTPVEPRIRTRYRAKLRLTSATYEVAERMGAFTFLHPVAPEGYERMLFGLSTSVMRAGQWQTNSEFENPEVLEGIGIPAATIPGRLVVLGSDEEKKLRAEWEAQAEARHQAELAEIRRAEARAAEQRAAEAAAAEARRQQAEADAVAAARREAAAKAAQAEAQQTEAMRTAEEAQQLAATRRAAAEALEATAKREAEARLAAERAEVEGRSRQFAEIQTQFTAADRNVRLAAVEKAMRSDDPAARAMGYEAALTSGDAVLQNLGLRVFFSQKHDLPITIFAPAAAPRETIQNIPHFLASLSNLMLSIREFNPTTGEFAGLLSSRGEAAVATGTVTRSEMTIRVRPLENHNDFNLVGWGTNACGIDLRLSEVQTLDGTMQCNIDHMPRLLVRITLD
jgi:hypothetical protein